MKKMKYSKTGKRSNSRKSRKIKRQLAAVIIVPVAGYALGIMQDISADPNDTKAIKGIARIKDGDTIALAGENIRLYGIDAPELKQICKKNHENWKCGEEAKSILESYISEKNIFCIPYSKDKYGRDTSNCYVDEDGNKANIGQYMVSNGWALAYDTYSPRFIINELAAKTGSKGIWQSEFTEPWNYRRLQKSH